MVWLWGGKHQLLKNNTKPSKTCSKSAAKMREFNKPKLHGVDGGNEASERVKRKCPSKKEVEVDKEDDFVMVSLDISCLSGSEDDGYDWSIGWLEPHAYGFQSHGDSFDDSFAVLIRCYGREREVNV